MRDAVWTLISNLSRTRSTTSLHPGAVAPGRPYRTAERPEPQATTRRGRVPEVVMSVRTVGGFCASMLNRLRHGIAARLLAAVLLFSSAVTLLLSVLQLYLDYRRDVQTIESRLTEIQ